MKVGILGAGFIASVLARSFKRNEETKLQAVASRTREKAETFARDFEVLQVFDSCEELLSSKSCDMIYLATPTNVRHELAKLALETNHHLLIDKPFANLQSAQELIDLARDQSLAIMDATHFTHNPRTAKIRQAMESQIGQLVALRSSFFFPSMDSSNIRLQPQKEPTGAVGDMGWYNMRAIVEYLPKRGDLVSMHGFIQRDPQTKALVRGSGVACFSSGVTSSFDFGYSVGSTLMDLDLLGQCGVIQLSDFVLDWRESFAYQNENMKPYYLLRQGVNPLTEAKKIENEHIAPQEDLMVREFLKLCKNPSSQESEMAKLRAIETQYLVDEFVRCARVIE